MFAPAGIQQSQAKERKLCLKYLKKFWLENTSKELARHKVSARKSERHGKYGRGVNANKGDC